MESGTRQEKTLPPTSIFRARFSAGQKRYMVRKSPFLLPTESDPVLYGVAIAEKMYRLSTQTEAMSAWSSKQFTLPKPSVLQSTCR